VSLRTPYGSARALASVDSFRVGGRRYTIAGGKGLDSAQVAAMSRNGDIQVALVVADSEPPSGVLAEIPLAFFDDRSLGASPTARLVLTLDLEPTRALR